MVENTIGQTSDPAVVCAKERGRTKWLEIEPTPVLATRRHQAWMRKKLKGVYRKKYRIRLDHQILTHHGVFYPQALYNDLIFELTLAAAHQVVKGSDVNKLVYKLINIQLEYEMIRSRTLADEATSAYSSGKEFAYDHVMREEVGLQVQEE